MENKNKNKLNLIFLLIFLVLNISLVSSAEWDNVYNYNSETKTVTIENWFGLGEDLAYVTLTSPNNVQVARGIDKLVGEFNFTTTGNFTNTFGDIYLTNLKNGNSISRGRQFKYKKYTNISIDDYETICNNMATSNGTIQNCTQIEVGNHWEIKIDWIPIINPTNIFYSDITYEIGVFVDVEKGDYGEWIPSIMGVEIKEWAVWTENMSVNITSYYKLDESSGTVAIDELDTYNGSNIGATVNISGILNTAYFFENDESDYVNITGINLSEFSELSYSFWVNISSYGDDGLIGQNDGEVSAMAVLVDGGGMHFELDDDGSWGPDSVTTMGNGNITLNNWHHLVATWNGTTTNIYLDGVFKVSGSFNGSLAGTTSIFLGQYRGNYMDGIMDEVGIWSRELLASEVSDLYNGGNALPFNITGPVVNIIFPENITYNGTITELNYTVDVNGNRCWFSTDGGITNSSDVAAGTNFTGLTSNVLQNEWIVYCNDSDGNVGSGNVLFFVNISVLTELISPVNLSNFTTIQINFTVSSTPFNTNLTNATLYVWYENGTLFLTNETTLSGDSGVQTNFSSNLTDGIFLWNAETCGENVNCTFADDNRTLEVHTTPSTVIIHYPNETISYLAPGGNLTLNWTISESGQNLSEHIINCSYTYNGVETQLNLTQCIETNETTFLYVNGINNLTFEVIEEFGLITTNTTTWNFLFEKYNVTFDNQTLEGAQETFTAEIILGGGETISQAIFYYNDTNYTTNIIFIGGEYTITSSITIPLIDTNTNFSLGFYIVVGGITYNLETFEQQVISINMSLCGASNDTLLNMSLFNEETKVSILGDIEINAQAISKTSGETAESFNTSFTNVSSARICLSPISAYSNLYFGTEIRYSSDNFVPEFYHIQMADMADYPRNLSLFDLAINDSTEFLIKYQDDNLITVEGAIVQLQRKYISEDVYEVVEAPLTSNAGTAIVHIDLNTNKYRASIVKGGVLLDFFDNIVFDCENELSGECTQLLLGKIDPQNDVPLIDLTDFSYSISSVNNTITTTFIIPSGTPSTINVVLTQVDQFGNETTCNQSIISSGGSIDCTFSDTIGDSFLGLEISKDQELQAQQTYIVVEDATLNFLGNNFFILIIILLSLVGMAFSSPEWMIINAVVVMLIGGAFYLVNGMNFVMGLGSLIWLIISALILIIKLSKQEDR